MTVPTIQITTIILPQVRAGVEDIDDLVTHESLDLVISESGNALLEWFQEKQIHIIAIEVVTAGVPGNLWCWIELSPVPSTTSTAYWAAIGGGGGALIPTVPLLEVATGVDGTVHTMLLPWSIHSPYARVVVQTPIAAALPGAYWEVQCLFTAKGP